MLNLTTYKELCDKLVEVIAADRLVLVVIEDHLKKKLQGATGTIFAAVYPSCVLAGESDNVVDINSVLFYVLMPSTPVAQTDGTEIQQYVSLQQKINAIRDYIITTADQGDPVLQFINRESVLIDPAWNIAGGYNGYSLAFDFAF